MDDQPLERDRRRPAGSWAQWQAVGSVAAGMLSLVSCWLPVVPVALGLCAVGLAWLSLDAEDARVWAVSGFVVGLIGLVLGSLATAVFFGALHAIDSFFDWWNLRGI